MPRKIVPMDELEGFLGLLEHERLETLEEIVASQRGHHASADMEKLALLGNAIQSTREAIAFRVKTVGR